MRSFAVSDPGPTVYGDKIGGGAEDDAHHKYIFTFMNIETDDSYTDLSGIIEGLRSSDNIAGIKAASDALMEIIEENGKEVPKFFKNMVVTCEHRSSSRFTDGGVPFYGYDVFNA